MDHFVLVFQISTLICLCTVGHADSANCPEFSVEKCSTEGDTLIANFEFCFAKLIVSCLDKCSGPEWKEYYEKNTLSSFFKRQYRLICHRNNISEEIWSQCDNICKKCATPERYPYCSQLKAFPKCKSATKASPTTTTSTTTSTTTATTISKTNITEIEEKSTHHEPEAEGKFEDNNKDKVSAGDIIQFFIGVCVGTFTGEIIGAIFAWYNHEWIYAEFYEMLLFAEASIRTEFSPVDGSFETVQDYTSLGSAEIHIGIPFKKESVAVSSTSKEGIRTSSSGTI